MFGTVSQSGNTPTMYNPICCLDASDTSSSNITESAGLTSSIKDRSGNGNDFGIGTAAWQPITNSVTINGLNALSFVKPDRIIATISTPNPDMTVISVIRPVSSDSSTSAFFSNSGSGGDDFQLDAGTSGQYLGRFNSSGLGHTYRPDLNSDQIGNDIVTTYRLSDADSEIIIRLNGVQTDSDNYDGTLNSSLLFRLGTNRAASQFLNMYLAEVLIFNEALTDTQIDTIETYLTDKWGIS